MDAMFRSQGNEFAGRHRPGFERGLRRRVILDLHLGFAFWLCILAERSASTASVAFGEWLWASSPLPSQRKIVLVLKNTIDTWYIVLDNGPCSHGEWFVQTPRRFSPPKLPPVTPVFLPLAIS